MSPTSQLFSFSQSPGVMQPTGVDMSAARQPVETNISMSQDQDMDNSTKPMLEFSVIPYNNNQPADSDLWNSLFPLSP